MTPLQAYELAVMFAQRKNAYITEIEKNKEALNADAYEPHIKIEKIKEAIACRRAQLFELQEVEKLVRCALDVPRLEKK